VETVRGLGATPETVDYAELQTAMATGTVDGQENPYDLIWNDKLYEPQDYVIHTNHITPQWAPYLNEDVWQSLSDEEQDVFINVSQDEAKKTVEEAKQNIDGIMDNLRDEGIEIITQDEIEHEEFKKQTQAQVWEKFPEYHDQLKALGGDDYGQA
jgi:TRAP-type C4-dicarboxylate transport system substrate-binding protein